MRGFFTPVNLNFGYVRAVLLLFLISVTGHRAFAQTDTIIPAHRGPCMLSINTFPYEEGFETSMGNWFSGGQSSDWAWGTPSKTVINAAGEGSKCWISGGLTGSSYNSAELSWVQSPCFDLSVLSDPEISFKIFWESERKYDGAGFEYSTDGGTTWKILGSASSNSNCMGTNWFNTASIQYLGNIAGWSGNIQPSSGSCQGGGGSNGWLIAKHSLQSLIGETNVSFRFTFASGTACNGFEGVAFDAVRIGEAPPKDAGFSFSCVTNNKVSFSKNANCTQTTTWNFGDPGSGTDDVSTLPDPVHVFSTPGPHSVTLNVTFPDGGVAVLTKQVIILTADASVTNNIRCSGGNDGAVTVVPAGAANFNYSWNTSPPQTTPSISGLPAGTYIVTVTSTPSACAAKDTVELTQPDPIFIDADWGPAICTSQNGQIRASPGGGTAPYTFLWSNGETTGSVNGLAPGNYSVKVTDANGCSFTSDKILIDQVNQPVPVTIGNDTFICPGSKLILSPGRFQSYRWQDGTTAATYNVSVTGTYSVQVVTEDGCVGNASVNITVDCSDVYFPSGFTPNGDGRNDKFGPAGNTAALRNYSLTIFNRYGQQVFHTNDPLKKWDGRLQSGQYNSGVFVWTAGYSLLGKSYTKKGTLLLIR